MPDSNAQEVAQGKNSSKTLTKWIFILVLVIAIYFGSMFFWPQIANSYEHVKNATETAIQPITQIANPQQVITQYDQIWGSTTVAPELNKFSLEFKNAVNPVNGTLNVAAELTVKADEDLILRPQCYLDGQAISTDPTEKTLPKSDGEQHFSVTCSNGVGGKELSIKIGNPSKIESVSQIWLGSGENKGKLFSKQDYSSSYSLSLSTLDDMPFNDTAKKYPLLVQIRKDRQSSTLKSIESLKISTIANVISIECPFGNEFSGDRMALTPYADLANKNADQYNLLCQVSLTSPPGGSEYAAFIAADMAYTAEEEFKTSLASINTA